MKEVKIVNIKEIEQHLQETKSNIFFDKADYGLGAIPKEEFECYCATLESTDAERLFLVPNFSNITKSTCKLVNLDERETVLADTFEDRGARIRKVMEGDYEHSKGINLLEDRDFELVLLAQSLNEGPMVLMDGSHRAIAHYIMKGNIHDVRVYICVHKDVTTWSMYPHNLK